MPDPAPLKLDARFRLKDGPEKRETFELPPNQELRLGRVPRMDPAAERFDPVRGADLVFPHDPSMSNNQATLRWDGRRLHVRERDARDQNGQLPTNPAMKETRLDPRGWVRDPDFTVAPGGRFRVGDTYFTLAGGDEPLLTIAVGELRQKEFRDPGIRGKALDVLPKLVAAATDEAHLVRTLLEVALEGLAEMDAAALVELGADDWVTVVALRRRAEAEPAGVAGDVRLSQKLVVRAVQEFEPTYYDWGAKRQWAAEGGADPTQHQQTARALCVRLPGDRNQGLYLSADGPVLAGPSPEDYLKFATLAGDIFAGLRDRLLLQHKMGYLYEMLSGPVRRALDTRPPEEVFAARECDVTVLFCDLRGFTRAVAQGERALADTWQTLSEALDAMAGAVVQYDGVVGDFQGDAVMGFWGWPLPQPDQVERAAQAALMITGRFDWFKTRAGHPLATTTCGIGLASGPAIAGKLGAFQQTKIGVFGSVVNRAARLETATKRLGVPVLIDEAVYQGLDGRPFCRRRKVAPVVPAGLDRPVLVAELLPPAGMGGLSEEHRVRYEAALARFMAGQWDKFVQLTDQMPADGPARLVRRFVEACGRDARLKAGWDATKGIPLHRDDDTLSPPAADPHKTAVGPGG